MQLLNSLCDDLLSYEVPVATGSFPLENGLLLGTQDNDVFDSSLTPTAVLAGGRGDDSYIVDNANRKIKELPNQGIDTVFSGTSFELSSNIENLCLTGSNPIAARGNKLSNVIWGNDGDNGLFGLEGNDFLIGGSGRDKFFFDTKLNARTNVDTLIDFNPQEDSFVLKSEIFKKLGASVSSDELWFSNSGQSQGTNAFLVYDAEFGILSYDADGSGKGQAIQIARIGIKDHSDILATNFFII